MRDEKGQIQRNADGHIVWTDGENSESWLGYVPDIEADALGQRIEDAKAKV